MGKISKITREWRDERKEEYEQTEWKRDEIKGRGGLERKKREGDAGGMSAAGVVACIAFN